MLLAYISRVILDLLIYRLRTNFSEASLTGIYDARGVNGGTKMHTISTLKRNILY